MYEDLIKRVHSLVSNAQTIFDAGSGPTAAFWYSYVKPESDVVSIDMYFNTNNLPENAKFYKKDIVEVCKENKFQNKFDLVIGHHLLEHVTDVHQICEGFNRISKVGGHIHIGIPDASFFSDRFYRLLHLHGGGHCSLLTLESLTKVMRDCGFERVEHFPWEESWTWLDQSFDPVIQERKHVNRDDLKYVADVFRKELTAEKEYYYGWEIVFRKVENLETYPRLFVSPPAVKEEITNEINTESERQLSLLESAKNDPMKIYEELMKMSDWASSLDKELKRIKTTKAFRIYKKLKKIFPGWI